MTKSEKEIEEHINSITHPLKKQWYEEAYELLNHTFGYPFESLSKNFVEGFIDGYVHAKSLEQSPINQQP